MVGTGPVVTGADPAFGAEGIDREATFRVFFDRIIYPGDVHRGHFGVQSGARSVFVSGWFDPVDRVLVVENLGDPLEAEVTYRLRVAGIADLDGVGMESAYETPFETGRVAVGERPRAVGWDRVAPILSERCATESCHGASAPVLGLDLSSAEGVRTTAIGVVAEEARVGTQGDSPWHGAPTLDGLARIDVVGGVGRPARSFLLYKVLGDPHAAGAPMPPDEPLSSAEIALISAWIRAGASTE